MLDTARKQSLSPGLNILDLSCCTESPLSEERLGQLERREHQTSVMCRSEQSHVKSVTTISSNKVCFSNTSSTLSFFLCHVCPPSSPSPFPVNSLTFLSLKVNDSKKSYFPRHQKYSHMVSSFSRLDVSLLTALLAMQWYQPEWLRWMSVTLMTLVLPCAITKTLPPWDSCFQT